MGSVLLYVGSATISAWGLAHIVALKPVVAGFGTLSTHNRRVLIMEWTDEGLTMIFVGLLVFLVTLLVGTGNAASPLIYRASAGMLLVMALVSIMTGARTSVLPMRLCPVVKSVVAALFVIGSIL